MGNVLQWSGIGCDVCGFGSVEKCEEFDPRDPCPECNVVAIPNEPYSIEAEILEPPATPDRYRRALKRARAAGANAIRTQRDELAAALRAVMEAATVYVEGSPTRTKVFSDAADLLARIDKEAGK